MTSLSNHEFVHTPCTLIIVVLSSVTFVAVDTQLIVPGLFEREYPYVRAGEADINIGMIVSIHQLNGSGQCSKLRPAGVLRSWVMQYALREVNSQWNLLPNITVGYVHFDDCWNALHALEVSMLFAKVQRCCCINDSRSADGCCNTSCDSRDFRFPSYDVIGFIGFFSSPTAVMVAPFLGTFRLPAMSIYATANKLSDKTTYPYFLRLVPPDLQQELRQLEV